MAPYEFARLTNMNNSISMSLLQGRSARSSEDEVGSLGIIKFEIMSCVPFTK
jgi:hypothetical protein